MSHPGNPSRRVFTLLSGIDRWHVRTLPFLAGLLAALVVLVGTVASPAAFASSGGAPSGVSPSVAPTTPPVSITTPVTDPSGFLSTSQAGEVRNAIATTSSRGLSTYYVLVPDFSDYDPTDWCSQSGNQSTLTDNSIVFVLAYEERDSSWCTNMAEDNGLITDSAVDAAWDAAMDVAAQSNPLTPQDAAGAGVAFVQVVGESVAQGGGVPSGVGGSSSGGSSWSGFLTLMIIIFIVAAILILFARRSSKKKAHKRAGQGSPAPSGVPTNPKAQQELVDQASQQLLAADELLRSAADEVQFTRAQFGYAQADQLDAAVTAAQKAVNQAFTLLPSMQDAPSLAQKAQVASQIMTIISTVMPPVYQAQEGLKELRERQTNADQRLLDLRERLREASEQVDRSERTLADLRLRFSPVQLQSLEAKPQEARAFIQAAERNCDEAQAQLTTNRSAAVESLDRATAQLASALADINAVNSAEETITAAGQVLASAIASLTSDLNDVDRLVANQANFAPLVSDARAAITAGQKARNGQGDPVAAMQQLRSAEDALDQALDPLRSAHDQQRRNADLAAERINSAQTMVTQAEAMVAANRHSSSLQARSAVANAQQQLALARSLQHTDPAAAINAANAALSSTQAAFAAIQASPPPSVNYRSSGNNSLMWGMLLGSMMGNNSRGHSGGWGSPPPRSSKPSSSANWGSFGGGGGSRGSSGGFRGSSGGFRGGGGFGGGGGGRGKF